MARAGYRPRKVRDVLILSQRSVVYYTISMDSVGVGPTSNACCVEVFGVVQQLSKTLFARLFIRVPRLYEN